MAKQFQLFMYSVQEKLLKLCPIMRDLLIEEGVLKSGLKEGLAAAKTLN